MFWKELSVSGLAMASWRRARAAGGVVHLPKTIPHALYNPLKTPLRILALAIPGGMEMFFDELESAMQDGSMDDAKHREISRKYGIEWLE